MDTGRRVRLVCLPPIQEINQFLFQPSTIFGTVNIKDKLISVLDWLIGPVLALPEAERRQAKLLAWILLFTLLFSTLVLFIILFFNPLHTPYYSKYDDLIIGLIIYMIIAFALNRRGHYKASAIMLVAGSALAPWASLVFDTSILHGDFVPLLYFTFSVLLSSILLPSFITILLAVFQFTGLSLVLFFSPVTSTFNWFSFLAYAFLTSVFSILANSIIQGDLEQIETQTQQLARNEAIMREQSIRDDLTCLYNRRFMVETLKRETLRAARKQTPLGIIMLDVDHFKQVNDTQGHAAGDVLLQKLGIFFLGQVRQSDIVCRYGGDEFVIVLPEVARETAIERAEQLRLGLKSLDFPPFVKLSLGVAFYPENGSDDEVLLKSADNALYKAKHDGGDCVRLAG